jgi:hypothetical protein
MTSMKLTLRIRISIIIALIFVCVVEANEVFFYEEKEFFKIIFIGNQIRIIPDECF